MKKLGFIFFFNLLLFFGVSCEKENTEFETDPKKAILGKWEVIEMGNWPDLQPVTKPSGYVEYLPDSIMREYDYETGEYFYKKYWINRLIYQLVSSHSDMIFLNNKMRLNLFGIAAIFNTFILKKIK